MAWPECPINKGLQGLLDIVARVWTIVCIGTEAEQGAKQYD